MGIYFCNFFRKFNVVGRLLGLALAGLLLGCRASDFSSAGSWETYRNDRFGFEFLYPKLWVSSDRPENRDGIAFHDPKNPQVEIRGWASPELTHSSRNLLTNFTTQQGNSGNLEVKISARVSSMTMTIVKGNLRYSWRGSSLNAQFDRYYQLFYYIASHFQISDRSE